MTGAELRRREKILDDMNDAAYRCAGALAGLVQVGAIKQARAVLLVEQFNAAVAAYDATNVVDKARA